jgi:hypothetical protein
LISLQTSGLLDPFRAFLPAAYREAGRTGSACLHS